MVPTVNQGSVRVDLVGGTLDIHPINLILDNVFTINVATSLKAQVKITKSTHTGLTIISQDYNKKYQYQITEFTKQNIFSDHFQEMSFLVQLMNYFNPSAIQLEGMVIELASGAPAGSGLGGSSAMGITFMQAMSDYLSYQLDRSKMLKVVMDIEARFLNCGPTGYQDYYPALYGGVLALEANVGEVIVHQLYTPELKQSLESNITLVFSGKSRFSAINNWEVYQAFFKKDEQVVTGLKQIASLSNQAYQAIIAGELDKLLDIIRQEGELRSSLFSEIETVEMRDLKNDLLEQGHDVGLKVCGAGGGGCFLIIHPEVSSDIIARFIKEHQMDKLEFKVDPPIEG